MIIKLLGDGNDEAYRYLFKEHYAPLCFFAEQYLHDRYQAESVVSDVICHIWIIREHLDIRTSLRKYLMRSVRNKCLDYIKSGNGKSVRTMSFNNDDLHASDAPSAYIEQPLGILIEKECENEIMAAINSLPEECRHVFTKSRFENKKYREIASELGISISTVKYHMTNALAFLEKKLGKYLLFLLLYNFE